VIDLMVRCWIMVPIVQHRRRDACAGSRCRLGSQALPRRPIEPRQPRKP